MSKKTKPTNKIKESIIEIVFGILLIIFIIIAWWGSWIWIDSNIISDDKELSNIAAAGAFGDKFGAVNSIFSGLAFGGIIFTILLQKKELRLQREELRETREVFIIQNETLENQKFENTFFQMLNLFHSIINTLEIRRNNDKEVLYRGRDCFKYFVKQLKKEETTTIDSYNSFVNIKDFNQEVRNSSNLTLIEIQGIYDAVYQKHKSNLSHYFRTLYHIIKFIDESEIKDKRKYISITRAQLSSYEQVLLYYNCIHPNGNKRFKSLIEKYSLLHNIDSNELLHISHYKNDFYLESAFENENI